MIITNDILDTEVPQEMIPSRLDSAMNLYTNISIDNQKGIIVYNTNPTTWNCLYPFYELNHKFTIDNYNFNKKLTYRDLINEYQEVYKSVYEDKNGNTKEIRKQVLLDEYKKTFGLNNVVIGDELLPIYELKYSKSKNVWTLYYFENYIANIVEDFDILLSQKIYEQKILPIDCSIKELDGIPLVSNLPYLLSIESNVIKLKNNIIERKM